MDQVESMSNKTGSNITYYFAILSKRVLNIIWDSRGQDSFVDRMLQLAGRTLGKNKPGHQRKSE